LHYFGRRQPGLAVLPLGMSSAYGVDEITGETGELEVAIAGPGRPRL